MDDLVIFILRNSNGKYAEEKTFRDVFTIVRTWPPWMIRELLKALTRRLASWGADPETAAAATAGNAETAAGAGDTTSRNEKA